MTSNVGLPSVIDYGMLRIEGINSEEFSMLGDNEAVG